MSVHCPQVYCPAFVPCCEMTEVMISSTPMEDMRLSPSKDSLTFQIFPDPSDFERCCKVKDRLPSIVVEITDVEVESGELRWPPKEFIVSEKDDDDDDEDEEDDDDEDEEEESDEKPQTGQVQNSQH